MNWYIICVGVCRRKVKFMKRFDISNARIEKGYTQEQFALKLGITKDHYAKIERGLSLPNVCTGLKICLHLGLEPFTTWLTIEK